MAFSCVAASCSTSVKYIQYMYSLIWVQSHCISPRPLSVYIERQNHLTLCLVERLQNYTTQKHWKDPYYTLNASYLILAVLLQADHFFPPAVSCASPSLLNSFETFLWKSSQELELRFYSTFKIPFTVRYEEAVCHKHVSLDHFVKFFYFLSL